MTDLVVEEDVDLDGLIALGQDEPALLLRWVYESLGIDHETPLDKDWIAALHRGALRCTDDYTDPEFSYCLQLKRFPVDVETFMFGSEYLAKGRDDIYAAVLEELVLINNPHGQRVVNCYTEACLTGGIGSAKTTTALYTVTYQLYVLSCFDNPHNTFGLDPSSEILFVFLGMAGDTASADYDRFYAMIIASPYFKNVFPYDKRKKTELDFPHRIQVVSGINTIGQNVMGGLIDEVNFGALISKSSRSIDGGEYNQTLTVYNGLARRRKSRFNTGGRAPGILCLVSSKRYPGEFTDVKLEEAKTDKSIYVYDKRVWDVKPPGTFSSESFEVFVGDAGRKACIVEDDFTPEISDYPDRVVKIPLDFYKDFKDDLIGSLRDIAGVSTLARYPYFQNVNAIGATFGKVESILSVEETDMITTQLAFYPSLFKHKECPRWVHVDLGVTSDAAGIACGYVPGFITTKGGAEIGPMPKIVFDFVLRVKPPKNGEIQFHKIRSLLQLLREKGLPIQWVSFDSFQSVDSIQMLRQIGFATGRQSMDITNAPYAVAKTALYAGRVEAPAHTRAQLEFTSLEKDTRTGKIDHPKNGSKDASDAMAGVIYGLTMRRDVWSQHGVQFAVQYSSTKEVKVNNEASD